MAFCSSLEVAYTHVIKPHFVDCGLLGYDDV
jgi:hypothetical protein